MKNILVTIDFNKDESILIDKAFEFAKAFSAKVWLVHITAPDPDFVGYEIGPQYIRDCRANEIKKDFKLIQMQTTKLQAKGINTEGLIIQGATVKMILKESDKLNIDLIIIGHYEHGLLYNLFAEKTSEKIINKSKVPVLVIPIL